MSTFTWFRRAIAHRRRSTLIDTATEQIGRLHPDSWRGDRMLHGEALIISGVLATITALVSSAWAKLDKLARGHIAAANDVAALRLQIAQLPDHQHLVVPSPHQRRRRRLFGWWPRLPKLPRRGTGRFVSRLQEPGLVPEDGVYGDAISTTAATHEHDALTARIAADDAAGISRHHHHVARIWQWATRIVLFFDVVALATLTIKLMNVPLDLASWQTQPAAQIQRALPAVCFALFAALIVAVGAHLIGAHTWRFIHRTSPLLADTKPHKRVLVIAWSALVGFSLLMGTAILVRLHAEATGSHTSGSVAWTVALLIGLSGVAAPVAVGLVEAMHSSPEVQRRAALARIITTVNRDEQALAQQINNREATMRTLTEAGERLLADTRRQIDSERLPAHQAILILRARHGYAQEHASAIAYPEGDGFLADLDHHTQLAPLVDVVQRMRRGTIAPAEPVTNPAPTVPVVTTDPLTPSIAIQPKSLGHNGHPVTTG
ncbi:hypothetical protein [Mycolicibacterium llatzerense]|uniref:hypothetical protein n=1 Tax=Mycolicibacterium llatzerense TaxID=280871 RepID=UPI0008DDEF65|nr:hypothetical protein [Mycolicibacterium llatzerense]